MSFWKGYKGGLEKGTGEDWLEFVKIGSYDYPLI